MAKQQSHFSVSVGLAVIYVLLGTLLFNFHPEILFLASVILVIAGMLPNVDESSSSEAQELGGLLAAISPLVFLELYPRFQHGGITRLTLVVVCCYLLSRVVIARLMKACFVHRGVLHSLPAAVITFEGVYLLFWDLTQTQRIFLAFAGFAGFFTHLLMDAYTNLDLVGRAMGRGVQKQPGALKLKGPNWGGTFALYTCMMVLGWFVLKDIYPGFRVVPVVQY